MFGSIGVPELLVLGVLAGLASLFMRRGALAIGGPVLVLRKFEVNAAGSPAVTIEGRPSGLVAWLLTRLGLDTLTTLTVTDHQLSFKSASLSGEIHHVVPSTEISSTHCGYSQPIWLLILGGVILLFSMLSAMNSNNAARTFVGGLLLAGVLGVSYLFQRKIAISVETTGGMVMGLAFKPSAIEHVSVNLSQALQAADRINRIVVARSHGSGSI
jgi:hypothetical protein